MNELISKVKTIRHLASRFERSKVLFHLLDYNVMLPAAEYFGLSNGIKHKLKQHDYNNFKGRIP